MAGLALDTIEGEVLQMSHYVTLSVPLADPSPFLRVVVADNLGQRAIIWHEATLRDVTERVAGRPLTEGEWFVVGPEYIWYCQNNGSDGDDWSRNNVRTGGAGAIGWRVPRTDELAAELVTLDARLNRR